jgi:hypothetical protein
MRRRGIGADALIDALKPSVCRCPLRRSPPDREAVAIVADMNASHRSS